MMALSLPRVPPIPPQATGTLPALLCQWHVRDTTRLLRCVHTFHQRVTPIRWNRPYHVGGTLRSVKRGLLTLAGLGALSLAFASVTALGITPAASAATASANPGP